MEKSELLYILREIVLCFTIVLTSFGLSTATSVDDYQALANESQKKSEEKKSTYQQIVRDNEQQLAKYKEKHQEIVTKAETAFKEHTENFKPEDDGTGESLIQQVIQNNKNLEKKKRQDQAQGLIIFVSLSMPKGLLLSYHNQAKAYGGRVVIRGLVDNNFKKTVEAMDLGNSQKLVLDINPMLFKEHQVGLVPTILLSHNGESDKFTGSVSIKYALNEVSRNGDTKELAEKILKKRWSNVK